MEDSGREQPLPQKQKRACLLFMGGGQWVGLENKHANRNRVRWMVEAGGEQWVGSPPRQGVGGS